MGGAKLTLVSVTF